jgi:sn-glycerol 3-phosphate transport system permease protein
VYGWNQNLWPLLNHKGHRLLHGDHGHPAHSARLPISSRNGHLVMATVILALLPPVIVVAAMQRQFVKGLFESDK